MSQRKVHGYLGPRCEEDQGFSELLGYECAKGKEKEGEKELL